MQCAVWVRNPLIPASRGSRCDGAVVMVRVNDPSKGYCFPHAQRVIGQFEGDLKWIDKEGS